MQEDLEDTSEGGRQTLGLATARDLALRRDVCRGQLVGVLLAATEAEAEGLRTNGRFHGRYNRYSRYARGDGSRGGGPAHQR